MIDGGKQNIWDHHAAGRWICITTNGLVKRSGECVMGAGCAMQAAQRYPRMPKALGDAIMDLGGKVSGLPLNGENDSDYRRRQMVNGNHVHAWSHRRMITFPVKHFWFENADLVLIRRSCVELLAALNEHHIDVVYLPRPGCDNGNLDWDTEVKPVIQELLDDRVVVVYWD